MKADDFRGKTVLTKAICIAVFTVVVATGRAAWAVSSQSSSLPIRLGWKNIATAAVLVLASGGVGLSVLWRQSQLARSLLVACLRCSIQLNVVGGMVLTNFLLVSKTRPWMVLLWISTAGVLAAQEAAARVQYTYPRMRRHLTISLLAGTTLVLGYAALFQLMGPVKPWFSPRTWIPTSGMLLGNSLTASGLAMATWTNEITAKRSPVELRLCRGATWSEALHGVVRTTLAAALTPTINALSVTGVVHLPGMMTGQILAGQSPFQAAAYQVLIFFLIAATSSIAVQTVVHLAAQETVDKTNDRLAPIEALIPIKRSKPTQRPLGEAIALPMGWLLSLASRRRAPTATGGVNDGLRVDIGHKPLPRFELQRSPVSSVVQPVLRVKQVTVERTGATVSLDLYPGERVAIMGASGVGKSQILRTIAGLEKVNRHRLELNGLVASAVPMPTWRQQIALVPQERPTLEGTPRQFFEEVRAYHSQRLIDSESFVNGGSDSNAWDPVEIAKNWGLDKSAFDKQWSTLSGGEAQRASLAIALSLHPEVLLLDESTSAIDEATTLRVEETLTASKIPILMVSHSKVQRDRFCTEVLDVSPSQESSIRSSST